ncbi:MAG: dephospho-CoA kinase [Bacteroidota bacterium]
MIHALQIVGITGGIGSGKTTVCEVFNKLGYQIFSADSEAKKVMVSDVELVAEIKGLLGEAAYFPDGNLNRKWIGQQVFTDETKLQALNGLVHPATHRAFFRWQDQLIQSGYEKPFALYEAAILLESGGKDRVDYVLTVYAPQSMRIQRVVKRDQSTEAAVKARMDNQWPDARKIALADYTIFNDGVHLLIPQVMEAERFFREELGR